jgi:hypothetical protein
MQVVAVVVNIRLGKAAMVVLEVQAVAVQELLKMVAQQLLEQLTQAAAAGEVVTKTHRQQLLAVQAALE